MLFAAIQIGIRSKDQGTSAHAALLDCAYAFSPRVEECAADTVLLDIEGMDRLLGPPIQVAAALRRRLAEGGWEANIAVAADADTALLAVRGFPGTTVIAEGEEARRLGPLPIEVLHPDPETLDVLNRWGIRTLRELAALPPIPLRQRLGEEGVRLQQLAQGTGGRCLFPTPPPAAFEETAEMEYPVELLDPLCFVLNGMLERLCARLAGRALATQELHLRLALSDPGATEEQNRDRVHQRTLRLPVPMQDSKVFLKLLQLDLYAHPPDAAVVQMVLRMEPARPRNLQGGLFLPATPEPARLEVTLARLAAIVGEAGVGCAALVDTHRPDAFQVARFAPESAPPPATFPPPERPRLGFRVFRPPVQARVDVQRSVPACVSFSGQSHRVLTASGPWRSSGDWWRETTWSREVWDVLLGDAENRAFYRIFRDLLGGGWFLEGAYD